MNIKNAVGRELVPVKATYVSKEDCGELCGLFSKCWGNAQMPVEDRTNDLAGSFTDDPVLLSRDELEEMTDAWMLVEDNPLVVDSTIDNELGLDGEGNGNGTGVGCVGDADYEYIDLEMADKRNEEWEWR